MDIIEKLEDKLKELNETTKNNEAYKVHSRMSLTPDINTLIRSINSIIYRIKGEKGIYFM